MLLRKYISCVLSYEWLKNLFGFRSETQKANTHKNAHNEILTATSINTKGYIRYEGVSALTITKHIQIWI